MLRAAILVAVPVLGVALGTFAIHVARGEPGYWFAGDSTAGALALLGAGWALVGAGLASWWRRPDSRFGLLLVAAGFAWFVPELNNPGSGSSIAFTAGLALAGATPALVGHAVLAYPSGRLGSSVERAAVGIAYAGGILVVGLAPALVFDPAETCSLCPRNRLLVDGHESAGDELTRAGVYLGLVSAALLVAFGVLRLIRSTHAARPVLSFGVGYLVLSAATSAVWIDRGFLSTGPVERRLWLAQALALVAVSLAVAWSWLRTRRARAAVARLVVDLAQSPPAGRLRDALAAIAGDPQLVLGYPVGVSGRLVDADGRIVEPSAQQHRTSLVREGRTLAVLAHARGLLDDEQLVAEIASAARLALDNERLHAEVQARVEDLRASRARIVAAGDAERKRLERDLHDGAQQRLVALALAVRLARSRLRASEQLERAEEELRAAIADLRELAHGIFPAVLGDEGLAAAVESLAEDGRIPIRIGRLPDERFAPQVESAAYTVVVEAARAATGTLAVDAAQADGLLVVDLAAIGLDALDVVGLRDRVGALDGSIDVAIEDGRTTIRAELPCAS